MEHSKKGTLLKVGLGLAAVGGVIFFATRSNAATNPVTPPAPGPTPTPPAPGPGPLNGGAVVPIGPAGPAGQAAGQAGAAANAVNAATANPFPGATAQGQGQATTPADDLAAAIAAAGPVTAGVNVGAVLVAPMRCLNPHGCWLRPAPFLRASGVGRILPGAQVSAVAVLPGGKTDVSSPGAGGWLQVQARDSRGRAFRGYVLREWFA